MAAMMGTVACPPQVTILMLGASRLSSRFTTGTVYGPMAAGVRSITLMPCSCSSALWRAWAPALVASNTMRMSWKLGSFSSPSIPSWVVGTPSRAARARPSELGSIPTMAPMLRYLLWRSTLIIRSVPILPEPIMATAILGFVMCVTPNKEDLACAEGDRYRAYALDHGFKVIAAGYRRHGAQSAGQNDIPGLERITQFGQGAGQPGGCIKGVAQALGTTAA